jgi:hypothetical protein
MQGDVALTVTVTGISGATMARALLDLIGIDDPAVRCLRRRYTGCLVAVPISHCRRGRVVSEK